MRHNVGVAPAAVVYVPTRTLLIVSVFLAVKYVNRTMPDVRVAPFMIARRDRVDSPDVSASGSTRPASRSEYLMFFNPYEASESTTGSSSLDDKVVFADAA